MKYRLGKIEDISAITILICDAIKEMEQHGIYQWDEIYPTVGDFTEDIIKEIEQNRCAIAVGHFG